jgi:hypothetical protein
MELLRTDAEVDISAVLVALALDIGIRMFVCL